MKQSIKLKFVDFYAGFNKSDNEFLDALRERYDVRLVEDPDFIIYSGFGYDYLKYTDCVRIFYTGECITPDFNECDYAIGFDRLQFGDRYVRIPLYDLFQYKQNYRALIGRAAFAEEELNAKEGFCNFVYSNCFAHDLRTEVFKKLSAYKQVASGGRYMNNVGGPVADKKKFQSKFKFSIAFENTSHDGYATEKIMEAFAARTIPIYYGDPNIAQDFNPKAFINAHDYASLDEVVKRVEEIDKDDQLYLKMINEPIVNPELQIPRLADFLYAIFDLPKEKAFRRSFSIPARAQEAMKLRHVFFETRIYRYWRKGLNQIERLRKGVSFSKRE